MGYQFLPKDPEARSLVAREQEAAIRTKFGERLAAQMKEEYQKEYKEYQKSRGDGEDYAVQAELGLYRGPDQGEGI